MDNSEMTTKLAKYLNEDGYYVARKILQDFDGLSAYQAFFVNHNPNVAKYSAEYQFAVAANDAKMAQDQITEAAANAEIEAIETQSDDDITPEEWVKLVNAGKAKVHASSTSGYRRLGMLPPTNWNEQEDGA